MKLLFNKLVIAALVLSMLIVLVAYLGSQWLYKTDPEFASTSTVSVPDRAFSGKGVSSRSPNAEEYSVPDSKSAGSIESTSSSEPETVSEISDEEREAAMRQIRLWKETIKEAEAGLPPLMLSNPEQYLKEWERRVDDATEHAEKCQREAEAIRARVMRGETIRNPGLVTRQEILDDIRSSFLQTAKLRRELEEYRSQHPHEEVIAAMIEGLKKMEARRDEDEAFAEKLLEKLNEKGIGF